MRTSYTDFKAALRPGGHPPAGVSQRTLIRPQRCAELFPSGARLDTRKGYFGLHADFFTHGNSREDASGRFHDRRGPDDPERVD
jgi:hypothetical protein